MILCSNGCGKNVQRSGLETHLTDNCPKQIVNCQYCGQGGTRGLITGSSHLRTHVSCHIYPMEGEYDDTLEWHFQGKVTIKLLNQLEDKNHSKLTILLNADDGMER
uniref:TRAF-type domain-containing protein n=1 Tax=Amphimedon queenslandica TaxID=400682 RepID=A0A1X7TMG6_AMPQE